MGRPSRARGLGNADCGDMPAEHLQSALIPPAVAREIAPSIPVLPACPNRLTIRMKVAEPQVLAKLQTELLQPKALAHMTKSLEKEVQRALASPKTGASDNQRQLEQERRKLQNLVAAIEGGASVPSTLLKAIAAREATIKHLEAELRKEEEKPSGNKLPDLPSWVREQLKDLAGPPKSDPAKVKSEFRRLSLQLTFHPTEAEPRAHYIVKGQCDLGALVFFYLSSRRQGAVLDSSRERSVHSCTPVC